MSYADDTWDIDDSERSEYLVDKEYIYMSLDQGVVDLNGGLSTQKAPSQCLNRRWPVISCVIKNKVFLIGNNLMNEKIIIGVHLSV